MSIDRFTPHNLAEILRDQFHAEASGTLVLEADTGEEIRIYFSRGLIDLALQAGPHLEFLSDLMSSSTSVSKLPEHLRERPPRPVELAELLGDDVGRPEVQKAVRRETDVAVQEAFEVKVESVNTQKVPGKVKKMGRHAGRTPVRKKAYVTLKEGEKIEMFEGV